MLIQFFWISFHIFNDFHKNVAHKSLTCDILLIQTKTILICQQSSEFKRLAHLLWPLRFVSRTVPSLKLIFKILMASSENFISINNHFASLDKLRNKQVYSNELNSLRQMKKIIILKFEKDKLLKIIKRCCIHIWMSSCLEP